jgi:hypothetical protein
MNSRRPAWPDEWVSINPILEMLEGAPPIPVEDVPGHSCKKRN